MQHLQELLDGVTPEDATRHQLNIADMMICWMKENQGANPEVIDSMLWTQQTIKEIMARIKER